MNPRVLSIEENAAQKRERLGCKVHCSHGVWWERHQLLYAKPAFEFQRFAPGTARPSLCKGFVAYSHQVPGLDMSNRTVDWMMLEGEDLAQFTLTRLSSEKRNQVRKGLKNCEVRVISDIEPHVDEALDINTTQAERHMTTGWFTRTPEYFKRHSDAWKAELRLHFSLPGWTWWGAFVEGQLAAYMRILQVADVQFVMVMKSHTSFMKRGVSDAIYFAALEQASRSGTVTRIVNGGPVRPGLDHFKEQFLFRRRAVPYYIAGERALRCGVCLFHIKDRMRVWWGSALSSSHG